MAASKKNAGKRSGAGTSSAKASKKKNNQKAKEPSSRTIHQVIPWIFVLVAVFLLCCYFIPSLTGALGGVIKSFFYGMFSIGAFAVPVILVVMALFWKKDVDKSYVKYRLIFALLSLINLSVIMHGINGNKQIFSPVELFKDGCELRGGGAIGGVIGSALFAAIGYIGLYIVSISLFALMTIFLCGLTPHAIAVYVSYYLHERRENREQKKEEREKLYLDKPEPYVPDDDRPFEGEVYDQPTEIKDVLTEDSPYEPIDFYEEEAAAAAEEQSSEILTPVSDEPGKKKFPDAEGSVDLTEIFGDSVDMIGGEFVPSDDAVVPDQEAFENAIEVERETLNEGAAPVEEKPKPEPKKYIFPPITLLESGNKHFDVDRKEIESRAVKLIDTLASFKVNAKISDIATGPTITRYELVPEEGVRVRSIANLVDDIALAMATQGVRIEAPIPGKAAVGIEVPNEKVATVHLRDLIEDEQFKKNKSRVNVALGMDVAGAPIYLDIAKMPHLLIAGTTGSGKSVCINSMIISILYKATPDEVKLILIDPKRVEFNIFNGLPHLLVPVVTDRKKAAGALQWAVNEMERRYDLMEDAGVRDIYHYNLATKDDPTFEFLPQIVVIIDEFADLMQTAPDSVEDCVCRLAQKARAAGLHLIIGTQRPSVDVITGLIKSNFPSRIAFSVKSQVDSRTMIDMAGAEKLIGHGDMLYAPLGAFKPIRVQGTFVSPQEIEAVTGFVKAKAGEIDYDEGVIEGIEREAARCATKKSGGGGASFEGEDDEENDPMLKSAIELAVDSGKISTSLIQRKLSLGYGRAAKLIDKMEQMGIVGPQDGNKPREILLTRQEYMEMIVHNDM